MWCPRCGGSAAPNDRFCTSCGAPFGPPCSACGQPTVPGDQFCTHCGASIETTGAVLAAPPPMPSGGPGEPARPWLARLAPPGGLDAFADPGASAVQVHLEAGTPLIVRRRSDRWAYVWAESGWMGWVDEEHLIDPDDGSPAPG